MNFDMIKKKITSNYEKLKNYLTSEVIPFTLLKAILIPIFWEQLFLACLSLFTIWLLSFDGENSMSVVNMMSVIIKIFTSLCLGVVTGGTVLVAQNIGAGRNTHASRSMVQTIAFAVALTAALGLFLFTVKESLIAYLLLGADQVILSQAALYFTGFCLTFPLYAFYQSFAGAMRGWGRSNLAWRLTLSVNATELTLIAVLLIGFNLGVYGVMLAMAISRVFGACFAAFLMARNRRELALKPLQYLAPDPAILRGILLIAVPLALEQFFFNSGKAVSQKYIASYGTGHMAAGGVVNAVFDLFNLPQITLREGLITVVGMCIGCGRYDLARRYVYRFLRIIKWALLCYAPLMIPLAALIVYSYHLSFQSNMLVLSCLTLIFLTGPFLLGSSLSIPAGLRAGGDAAFVALTALACIWGVRVVSSWVFAGMLGLGVLGINLAMVLDWIARSLIFRMRLRGEAWHSHTLIIK